MDYVVFGIGFGATILVLGLLIRDFGPGLRYRTPGSPDGVFHAEELVAKVAWTRFARSLGAVLAIGGVTFVIVTGVCMALMVSDSTGGWVMLGSLVASLILILFWTWAFFDRFGSYGILPERQEAPAVAPTVQRSATVADPPAERRTDRRPARREPTVVAGPPAPTPAEAVPAATTTDEAADTVPEEGTSIQTPEERLAGMQSPIEHGSAEDDLDIAAGAATRPRRSLPQSKPEEGAVADDAEASAASDGDDEADATGEQESGNSGNR